MKLSLILLLVIPQAVLSANFIMFLVPISKSMRNIFVQIADGLVEKGHTVTIVTSFGSKKSKPGIKEIVIKGVKEMVDDIGGDEFTPGQETTTLYQLDTIGLFKYFILQSCEYTLENKEIKAIIDGKEKYDMALVNLLFEDCTLGIVHKLGIPFAYVSSYGIPVEHSNNMRLPFCMPYCPIFTMTAFSNKMSFTERLTNTFKTLAVTWLREYYFPTPVNQMLREKLDPKTPPVLEIERNASLIIINDHFTMSYPRPLMPHIIEASGMHCKPAKPLPKELEEWIAGAGDAGFIYFSFGTVIPAHKIPEHFRKIIFEVLSKLPQRVIWKLDTPYANLPSNVKSFKWLPQQDILGDPRIRLFISHGGLLSLQETAYHGVPVLGIPVGIDQPYNLRKVEDSGTGIMLEWKDMTVDTFYNAIKKLTTDPNVKKNVKYRQAITKDLLNPPLEKAIYWIEYVLRYNGAEHLKSGGLYLKWYQYYQLDVWLFVITCIVLVILIIKKILKMLYRLIFKRATTHMKKD